MIKPKTRTERKSYWSSLSDTELLEVDLTIDNPDALENMVRAWIRFPRCVETSNMAAGEPHHLKMAGASHA